MNEGDPSLHPGRDIASAAQQQALRASASVPAGGEGSADSVQTPASDWDGAVRHLDDLPLEQRAAELDRLRGLLEAELESGPAAAGDPPDAA